MEVQKHFALCELDVHPENRRSPLPSPFKKHKNPDSPLFYAKNPRLYRTKNQL